MRQCLMIARQRLSPSAVAGSREIAKSLIEAKASVNARENEFHCEPLQWAARRGWDTGTAGTL